MYDVTECHQSYVARCSISDGMIWDGRHAWSAVIGGLPLCHDVPAWECLDDTLIDWASQCSIPAIAYDLVLLYSYGLNPSQGSSKADGVVD